MKTFIPKEVLNVYKTLQDASFQVFLVGGGVRNLFLDREIKDFDFTTSATPEQILSLFKDAFYDNTFGTVGVPIEQKSRVVEITTFRTEKGYSDKRRPNEVSWGKSIQEDLKRRDFTVNAIAVCFKTLNTTPDIKKDIEVIDPHQGRKDLEQKIIRCVGDPEKRFGEDALRLLRAIRIATQLNFTIEDKTWEQIKQKAPLLKHISKERINTELMRIIGSLNPYEGLMLLKESLLLPEILPELLLGVGVSQQRPGRHHTSDVFTHNVLSLKFCPSEDPIIRFATLIHDIGKPEVAKKDTDGLIIFHNHEIAGSRIAKEICERLKFSKKDREKIVSLVRWHMFSIDEKITDSAIRRFIRRIGVENVKDMIDLRIGDRLGGGTQVAESWRLKLFKKRVEEQLQPLPFSINNLKINGHDIIRELKINPGPKVGEVLKMLFDEVDLDLSKNTREYLLKRIKDLD